MGTTRVGGEHRKSKVLLTPRWEGKSVRIVSIPEGRQWAQEIREALHSITVSIAKEHKKPHLPAPSKMAPKNVTRWVKGSSQFPEEYEIVVSLGIMGRDDLWYFLDCEACFEAIGQILGGRKLANLPRSLLDQVTGRQEETGYVVGPSLAATMNVPDVDEVIEHWEVGTLVCPWSCSDDDEIQPWWCRKCESTYYATVDGYCNVNGYCPDCADD